MIDGQGSLVHWKYKTIACLLFLTSGLLGVFAFDHESMINSPLGLEPQVLLPLLSGIFGASSLLLSLSTDTEIPEQEESRIKMLPHLWSKRYSPAASVAPSWPGFPESRLLSPPSRRVWARTHPRRSSWYP